MRAAPKAKLLTRFSDVVPELINRQPQSSRDDFNRIQRRVRLPALQTTQVRLIEAAALTEFHLRHPSLDAELTHASAEALGQGLFHPADYPGYASNHIHTNSYMPNRQTHQKGREIPMKSLAALLAACALSACSDPESGVKSAIKSVLKDPESARFDVVLVSARKDRACAVWNAKNSLGGYGEWTVSQLRRQDSTWTLSQVPLPREQCTTEFFRLKDESVDLTEKLLASDRIPQATKVTLRNGLLIEHEDPALLRQSVEVMRVLLSQPQ